jgi:hypothetical protein
MTDQQHVELLEAIRENTRVLTTMLQHLAVLLDALPVDEPGDDETCYLDGSPR